MTLDCNNQEFRVYFCRYLYSIRISSHLILLSILKTRCYTLQSCLVIDSVLFLIKLVRAYRKYDFLPIWDKCYMDPQFGVNTPYIIHMRQLDWTD